MEHFVPSQDIRNILFYYRHMTTIVFPERLKSLRTEKSVSRTMLAEALHVSVRTVSHWENGSRECNFETLVAIANYFDCSVDYLLGRKEY